MPGSRSGDASRGGVVGRDADIAEPEIERGIVLLIGVERTVEEVEALEADLQLVRLADLEVLEDAEFIVVVGGSMNVRKAEGAVVSLGGCRKARGVEVLVRLQTLARIAGDEGNGGLVRSSGDGVVARSEEHTSELQSLRHLVCRLLLE